MIQKQVEQRVLHLVLKYHWYDEIASGRKTREYREAKEFWIKRIWMKHYDFVVFHRGYTGVTMAFKLLFKAFLPNKNLIELWLGERVEWPSGIPSIG